jgi:hypothetical protein
VLLYKRRCEQMRLATNLGVAAAAFLTTTLLAAALFIAFHKTPEALKYVSLGSSLVGLLLLIAAAAVALVENTLLQRAIDSEISDIRELSADTR